MKHLFKSSFIHLSYIKRAKTPEHGLDRGPDANEIPAETIDSGDIDTVQDAKNAETQAQTATEHGDQAVNQALGRRMQMTARHEGTLGGEKSYKTSAGYDIRLENDGGAEETRAIAEAVKAQKKDVAAANAELDSALNEEPEAEEPMPAELQNELGDIDTDTQTAENSIEAETNTEMAAVQKEANLWASGVTEDSPDQVMTAG